MAGLPCPTSPDPHIEAGSWVRLWNTVPVRHARAATALFAGLQKLRENVDETEAVAPELAKTLGQRELTFVCDVAGIALHYRLTPPL